MPCYNVEQTLDETMQSLVEQSMTDIEIVVVDDGGIEMSVCACWPVTMRALFQR